MAKPLKRLRSAIGLLWTSAILAAFVWFGQQGDSVAEGYPMQGRKQDYYNLLVAGFLDGSTAMKAAVDPGLLSPDAEIRRKASFLLDANLYRGKYYLYYGVVPALVFFAPYRLLTGHDLPTEVAIVCSVAIGFLAATAIWREARRRYFPGLDAWGEGAALLLIGFSTATLFLLTRSAFYEAPIAAGYACVMLACLAMWRSIHTAAAQSNIWLTVASVALGLAVSCRPNYIFALPVLLAVASWRLRRDAPSGWKRLSFALAAAIIPAALVGFGQACYNYARFENPFEFGFNYGLNSFFTSGNPLMSLQFVWPNLNWTYLSIPGLSPYFPFVFPVAGSFLPSGYHGNEFYHGQFPTLLLAIWVLVGRTSGNPPIPSRLKLFERLLIGIGVVSLGFMLLLGIRGNRYVVDFQAAFILIIAILGSLAWQQVPVRLHWNKIWRAGFIVLVVISTGFNFLGAIQQFDQFSHKRPETYKTLQSLGNTISAPISAVLGRQPGPVKFTVVFVHQGKAVVEPLVVAGLAEFSDSLYVVQYPDQRVEFRLDHHGYDGPRSESIPIELGHPYEIELDLGAFYPPKIHPFFRGYDPKSIDAVKNVARLRFDGRVILDEQMRSYDAPPWTLQFGSNGVTAKPYAKFFSGKISQISNLPNRHPAKFTPATLADGLWQLEVEISPTAIGSNQPILGSGVSGAGNLLFAKILSANQIQLGLDLWGYGAPLTAPITLAEAGTHRFEIFVGPLAGRYPWSASEINPNTESLAKHRRTLAVYIDGKLAWNAAIEHHVNSYDYISIGANPQGFGSATAIFSGRISVVKMSVDAKKRLLGNVLNSPPNILP